MKIVPRVHEYKLSVSWTGAAAGPTSDYAAYARDYDVAI